MNQTKSIFVAASIALALAFTFSCSSGGGSNDDTPSSSNTNSSSSIGSGGGIGSVNKFEAKPASETGNHKIKYSYSYDGYDFYYIYLGELRNIPVYYHDAIGFNTTEMTYQFSTATIATSTMRNTVSNSSQTTINVVDQYTKSTTVGVKLSQEINAKFTIKNVFEIGGKLAAEESWNWHTSNSTTTGFQETTSLTNTVERVSSFTEERRETFTWPLSQAKGDKSGWYRYTLFSVSDVYLYVIKDSTGVIYYEFREHVKPNVFGWMFDYSETMSFEKSDATSFEFDILMLDNLPKPELVLTPPPSAPNNVSVSAQSSKSIVVSWNSVSNANSYEIYRSESADGMYSLVGTSTSASYTDIGLSASTAYYYKVASVNNSGSSVFSNHASATTKSIIEKRIDSSFTSAGNHTYVFNKGFPAIIEVYALGAGGGGQGGHSQAVIGGDRRGTGGSGGGGSAAYMKFSVEEPITFNINVGKGGSSGGGKHEAISSLFTNWKAGSRGNDGGNTSVNVATRNLIVEGGKGGGGDGQTLTGGTGGSAFTQWSTNLLDKEAVKGDAGASGSPDQDLRTQNRGGNAGKIEKGSEPFFGAGLGAINNTAAQAGGGGRGGYNSDSKEQSGTNGGDGKVLIVIKYFEEL